MHFIFLGVQQKCLYYFLRKGVLNTAFFTSENEHSVAQPNSAGSSLRIPR